MNDRRKELINKLQSKSEFLSKEESEELGPVTNDELTVSGDDFIDEMLKLGQYA